MAYTTKGRRVMVFVDGASIAYATNHTLTITPNILEEVTKDDGDVPTAECDGYDWSMSTDSVIGAHEDKVVSQNIVMLIDKMLALEKVSVAFDAADPPTGSIAGTSGWGTNGGIDYPYQVGQAYIESLNITAGVTGYATSSISFAGVGDLV